MMRNIDARELKVGDEVGYISYASWGRRISDVGVTKVGRLTKTLVIMENGLRFNKHGKELKSSSYEQPNKYLIHPEEAKKTLEKYRRDKKVAGLIYESEQILEKLRLDRDSVADSQIQFLSDFISNFEEKEDDN